MIRARQAGNLPVPFGASVLDMDGKELGVIGQAGKLLARGLSDQGELQVQWKTDTGMVGCNLSYTLPERKRSTTYQPPQSLELPCVASNKLLPAATDVASAPPGKTAATANARTAVAGAPASNAASAVALAGMTQERTAAPATAVASAPAVTTAAVQPARAIQASDSQQALKLERDLNGLRMSVKISALPTTAPVTSNAGRTPVAAGHDAGTGKHKPPQQTLRADRPLAILQPSLKISALKAADKT